MYLKNKRDSSNIKAFSLFYLSFSQKDLSFEIAYFSYLNVASKPKKFC
jgi:hypothetical protein